MSTNQAILDWLKSFSSRPVLLATPKVLTRSTPHSSRGTDHRGSVKSTEQGSSQQSPVPHLLRNLEAAGLIPITNELEDKACFIKAMEAFAGTFGQRPNFKEGNLIKLLSSKEPRMHWPAFFWLDEKKSGFIGLVDFPSHLEIKSIFVSPKAQRKGLASSAVKQVRNAAQHANKSVFALVGNGDSQAEVKARAFWQSAEFDLNSAELYFSEHSDMLVTNQRQNEAVARQVFEFEDGVWQLDLGLSCFDELASKSNTVNQNTDFVSFVLAS